MKIFLLFISFTAISFNSFSMEEEQPDTDKLFKEFKKIIEPMIANKQDLNQKIKIDSFVATPLTFALDLCPLFNDFDLFENLLKNGANANGLVDTHYYTRPALEIAISRGNLELTKLLLKYKANPNLTIEPEGSWDDKKSLLHHITDTTSIFYGDAPEKCLVLLKSGANPNTLENDQTILDKANEIRKEILIKLDGICSGKLDLKHYKFKWAMQDEMRNLKKINRFIGILKSFGAQTKDEMMAEENIELDNFF